MKKLYYLTALLFIATSILAQTATPSKEKGYFNLTSLGAIIGPSSDAIVQMGSFVPSITTVNGYRFNKNLAAGVGVGADFYQYAVFPVFADIRYKLHRPGYYPFIALKGGYSFANSSKMIIADYYNYGGNSNYKNEGGWMFSPEVGVGFALSPQVDMLISLGYRYQKLESKISGGYLYPDQLDLISTNINRMTFNFGFQF